MSVITAASFSTFLLFLSLAWVFAAFLVLLLALSFWFTFFKFYSSFLFFFLLFFLSLVLFLGFLFSFLLLFLLETKGVWRVSGVVVVVPLSFSILFCWGFFFLVLLLFCLAGTLVSQGGSHGSRVSLECYSSFFVVSSSALF